MKRKILITTGTLLAVSVPITTVVSCGTSWHKWASNNSQGTPVQDPMASNIESVNPNASKNDTSGQNKIINTVGSLFATRDINEIKTKAYDDQTNTINLNELQNQFELNKLLVNLVGINSPESIERYWKSDRWNDFSTFVSTIKEKMDINIQYTNSDKTVSSSTVKWDISKSKQPIIDGFKTNDHFLDLEKDEMKYYNPLTDELTERGKSESAKVAASLANDILIVKNLAEIFPNYAIKKLGLLTNIPTPAFNAFKQLLTDIGEFTSQLYNVTLNPKNSRAYTFNNKIIDIWIKESRLNPSIVINDIDNPYSNPEGVIDSTFLLQAISREYDDLGK